MGIDEWMAPINTKPITKPIIATRRRRRRAMKSISLLALHLSALKLLNALFHDGSPL